MPANNSFEADREAQWAASFRGAVIVAGRSTQPLGSMGGEFEAGILIIGGGPLLALLLYMSARRRTRAYAAPVLAFAILTAISFMVYDPTVPVSVASFLLYFALGAIPAGVVSGGVALMAPNRQQRPQ